MKTKTPIGIIILSILYYISFIFSTIIAGIFFFKAELLQNLPNFNIIISKQTSLIFGGIMIFLGILSLISATGLLMKKNWARIILIIISIINLIGSILSLFNKQYLSIISIIFNLIVLLYLLLNKKIKIYFKKSA